MTQVFVFILCLHFFFQPDRTSLFKSDGEGIFCPEFNHKLFELSWAKLAADVFSPQEEHQDLKPTLIVDKPCIYIIYIIYIVTWCTGAPKRCFPISLHVKEASLKQWIQPQ